MVFALQAAKPGSVTATTYGPLTTAKNYLWK